MKTAVIYVHGKGGNTQEAEHYKKLFPACEVIGFDYVSQTPWEAKKEFTEFFDEISASFSTIILVANSIGAFFSMNVDFVQTSICRRLLWSRKQIYRDYIYRCPGKFN